MDNIHNTLKLIDATGSSSRVAKESLRRCAYFKKLLSAQPDAIECRVDAAKPGVKAFRAFLREDEELSDIEDIFESVTCFCSVPREEFTRCCRLAGARVDPRPQTEPAELPVISGSERCAFFELMKDVVLKNQAHVFHPVPFPLAAPEVTVCLIRTPNGNGTACLHNGAWLPMNLFGYMFYLNEDVKNFFLCFGRHVVYATNNGHVMLKDLQLNGNSARAQLLITNCIFFVSAFNHLYIICWDENIRAQVVYKWDSHTASLGEKCRIHFRNDPTWIIRNAYAAPGGDLILQLGGFAARVSDQDDCVRRVRRRCQRVDQCIECVTRGVNEDLSYINVDGSWTEVPEWAHRGYNIVDVRNAFGRFGFTAKPTVFEKTTSGGYYTVSQSEFYGQIIAFSDVCLL